MFGKITRAHGLLHLIVFIWGWSPILGRAIEAEALQLVWFRIAITTDRKMALVLAGIGGVIAFHWFLFYNGIKVSNVSVTLVGFSTGTIFTSLIEPLFYKRRIIPYELIFGAIIIFAIGMIMYDDLHTEHSITGGKKVNFTMGIIYGSMAALTSSLFTVWNGMLIRKTSSSVITIYELAGGLFFLTIFLFLNGNMSHAGSFFSISGWDYFFLSILAIVGTAFPFIASTNLLKKISPFTMTLTVNLETVYGIILAALLFNEHHQLNTLFYIATCIILLVIASNAILKNYLEKKKAR
jgi:drug/metabolite transporter (DMT)-like permease